jgi:methylglutaconyl-CoA hydratase
VKEDAALANLTTIEFDVDARGIARLTLARPQAHNAMNGTMYDEAREAIGRCNSDARIRALVLSGKGSSFCSGGDLKYQQVQAERPQSERIQEASKLAYWLREIDTLSKPVIGRINGPAYAGGLGLIAVCDIAIGVDTSVFAITEARLGLLPGMISPYVVRRIGVPAARRLFLTGRRISASEAVAIDLLTEAVPESELDEAVDREVEMILQCAPGALAASKRLIEYVSTHTAADNLIYTVDRVAEMWAWEEAAEGIRSFIEKRRPLWAAQKNDV